MNNNINITLIANKGYEINFSNKFIVDFQQLELIINKNVKWYYDDTVEYPYYIVSYIGNTKKIDLIELLFGNKIIIHFKSDNKYDLTKDNIIIENIKHKYNDIVCDIYKVLEYIQGTIHLNNINNPVWKINDNNTEYYLMYCNKDTFIKLTEKQYEEMSIFTKDTQLVWIYVYMKSPYIIASHNNKQIKLHHIVKSFNNKSIISLDSLLNLLNKLIKYDVIIKNDYNVINTIKGHIKNTGNSAGIEKNRIWDVNTHLIMYCEKDTLIKICKKSYDIILNFEKENNNNCKLTWYKMDNGYIACTMKDKKQLYMHQVIMNCHGNGKGTMNISVDHIDRDPTNNMMSNLRIATREDQEDNSKGIKEGAKRARKHNARPLPDGLTHEMLPKYVVYYKECYNKEKLLYREFFKIETHPKLDKIWVSSKSNNIALLTKLESAKQILNNIK
jgi:hypothetical protein